MLRTVEVMAPAGSYESLRAAIKGGAQSVYFGLEALNMRAKSSQNFTLEDLPQILGICREAGVRAYLALNSILYNQDLELAKKICREAKSLGVDAAIVSDVSLMLYAQSIGLPLHISTQANVSNIESLRFYAQFADVVVLARELSLQEITEISETIVQEKILGPSGELVKIELFVHGALCMSISGKCYLSLGLYNSSANRGACLQSCRRKYLVSDVESGQELVVDHQYIMSPKDLCCIAQLDKILQAGVCILKIEGRGRSAEYVYKCVQCYRQAVDSVQDKSFSQEKAQKWLQELKSVYNRGFWEGGYYLGEKSQSWTKSYGSQATKQKVYAGKALNYYSNLRVGEFLLEGADLKNGDDLLILGSKTGIVSFRAENIRSDDRSDLDQQVQVQKGQIATLRVPERVRKNDKLYLVLNRQK